MKIRTSYSLQFLKRFPYSSIKTNVYNTTVDSHLYLGMASASDSGTYSCNVADLAVAHLSLHILNGKSVIFVWSDFYREIYGLKATSLRLNYWPLEARSKRLNF